jgi:hypothetical protein
MNVLGGVAVSITFTQTVGFKVAKYSAAWRTSGVEIEIRRVFETEDFGAAMTPEMREQENRMRAQLLAAAKK